jgi:predicted enzyme related to lactoylglutathione lyase
MNAIQVEQKSHEMLPREGFTIGHFLTVADIDRSARFYEKVFGGRILRRGGSEGTVFRVVRPDTNIGRCPLC